jgi:uncharacterized protein (TIGR02145 family)
MKKEKIFQLPTLSVLIFALAMAMSGNARAQVTIGADLEPQPFSILELISGNSKGLRLPQMTTAQRDEMTAKDEFIAEKNGKARGLQIFNTTTLCVETWNGTKWIEQCMSCEGISFPSLGKAYSLCDNATVADLAAKVGADIYEFAEGGNKRSADAALSTSITYYAEQRVANCAAPARTPVTVNLGNCSDAVTNPGITTFVNVMYDFQHQTLEAYNTGGIATDYTWQAGTSTDESSFTDIPDAPNSAFFTVPAHFADAYPTGTELFFRCIIKNPVTAAPLKTGNLGIIFIKTNTSGYGIDANGVKYLTLQMGKDGTVKGGTMKVALLNLGQSADWTLAGGYVPNNEAGDLGDFYQWGRIADGHQNVVWSKNSSHNNRIYPFGATPEHTSDTVSRGTTSYDSNGQIRSSATSYYGKFILGISGDWRTSTDNYLWGNSVTALRSLTFAWKYPSNNPCPSGWRVPSSYNFWDLYRGTGSNEIASASTDAYDASNAANNNTWQWRAHSNNSYLYFIGGVIITTTNAFGEEEKLFLPASGYRFNSVGGLSNSGVEGSYWSSTFHSARAYGLNFKSGNVSAGNNFTSYRIEGHLVRCVCEAE